MLLQAAAREPRLRAVDRRRARTAAGTPSGPAIQRSPSASFAELGLQAVRGISGMRESPSLVGLVPRIAPRPVLLIAGGGDPNEIPTNRRYRDAGGPTVELWELPDTGHTAGLRTHPAEYERRTTSVPRPCPRAQETP